MATRLVKRANPANPPSAEESTIEAEGLDMVDVPEIDSLANMLADLGGANNARVTVYRVNKNRTQSYVFACSPEEFSLDALRDQYGGGDFRLYITKNGQLIKGGNRLIGVEARASAASAVLPTSDQSGGGLAELTAVMREFQAQQMAMMQAISRPPPSPFAGMDIPAVISAVTAAISVLRPPAPPAPPPAQIVDQSDRAIDMLMKGIALAKDFGGGGGESSFLDLARDAMKSPALLAAVQAAAMPPPQQRRPPPPANVSHAKLSAPAQTQPAPMTAEPATPATPAAPSQQAVIAHYCSLLVHKAAEGADPALYASMILDNVDDETIISMLARRPTAVDALIADCPPVATQRAWFEEMIELINQAYADDGEPPADDENMPHSPPESTDT